MELDHQTCTTSLYSIISDVCQTVITGDVSIDTGFKKLKELNTSSNGSVVSTVLLDCLAILEAEFDVTDTKSEFRQRLADLVKMCSGTILPIEMTKLYLETTKDTQLETKSVKLRTKLYFKQLKFNLLREESEGYAKLMTELNQPVRPDSSTEVALQKIRSLIGLFNLDPVRVADVIVESLECRPQQHAFYMSLLEHYGVDGTELEQLMGFKLTFYHSTREPTPTSLFITIALLVQRGSIDLLRVCQYLKPSHEDILKQTEQLSDTTKLLVKKANSHILGGGTVEDLLDRLDDQDISSNQLFCLVHALLLVGDWSHARVLLERLPEYSTVQCRDIALALCRIVSHLMKPLYRSSSVASTYSVHTRRDRNSPGYFNPPPPVQSWEDAKRDLFPLFHYLGPYIAADPLLLVQTTRLMSAYLEENQSNVDKLVAAQIVDIADECLVPALSFLRHDPNPGIGADLWALLQQFSYNVRYRIYGRWKIALARLPGMQITKAEVQSRTRSAMKRLSNETIKQTGRSICKFAHTHPTVVFDYIFAQVQTFENLIGPVVDCLRFLTPLSYDILAYCIIDELSQPGRSRLKTDVGTISDWLQAMATLVGALFKKYHSDIELTGVLQYVANQLKAGKSFDLLVLREVVQSMSGIETTARPTTEQMEALCGGNELRSKAGYLGQVRNIKRSTSRLREALLSGDLLVGLCLLMAQQRGSIIYVESDYLPVKLTGHMVDQCHETLIQFTSFLTANLRPDDYARRMPAVEQLLLEYHLGLDVAFFLTRTVAVNSIYAKYDELKKVDRANKSLTTEKKTKHFAEACTQTIARVAEAVRPTRDANIWLDFTPEFFSIFWLLSIQDIHVPVEAYDREIERIKRNVQEVEEKDWNDSKKRKERERAQNAETKLKDELKKAQEQSERMQAYLAEHKDQWLQGNRQPRSNSFIQQCLLPRAQFSDLDAMYCAKFVELLQRLKVPNFPTILCLDKIFVEMAQSLIGFSENDAYHYGRFLAHLFAMVFRWRSEEAFAKDCDKTPGFQTRLRRQGAPSVEGLTLSNYHDVTYKWHYRTEVIMLRCISSGIFTHIRNALIVLIQVVEYFPKMAEQVPKLQEAVQKLMAEEREKRPDLNALAASYFARLKNRKVESIPIKNFSVMAEKQQLAQQQAAKNKLKPAAATKAVAKTIVLNKSPNAAAKSAGPANPEKSTATGKTTAKSAAATTTPETAKESAKATTNNTGKTNSLTLKARAAQQEASSLNTIGRKAEETVTKTVERERQPTKVSNRAADEGEVAVKRARVSTAQEKAARTKVEIKATASNGTTSTRQKDVDAPTARKVRKTEKMRDEVEVNGAEMKVVDEVLGDGDVESGESQGRGNSSQHKNERLLQQARQVLAAGAARKTSPDSRSRSRDADRDRSSGRAKGERREHKTKEDVRHEKSSSKSSPTKEHESRVKQASRVTVRGEERHIHREARDRGNSGGRRKK